MERNIPKTGKKIRPKTSFRGKRYHCAMCRKRSPKPVKTPAPWYCPICLKQKEQSAQNKRLKQGTTSCGMPDNT